MSTSHSRFPCSIAPYIKLCNFASAGSTAIGSCSRNRWIRRTGRPQARKQFCQERHVTDDWSCCCLCSSFCSQATKNGAGTPRVVLHANSNNQIYHLLLVVGVESFGWRGKLTWPIQWCQIWTEHCVWLWEVLCWHPKAAKDSVREQYLQHRLRSFRRTRTRWTAERDADAEQQRSLELGGLWNGSLRDLRNVYQQTGSEQRRDVMHVFYHHGVAGKKELSPRCSSARKKCLE